MVARLKLKGIDGRAPPGVESAPESTRSASMWDMGCVLTRLHVRGRLIAGSSLYYSAVLPSISVISDRKMWLAPWEPGTVTMGGNG